jgi:hypothetical protein
MGRPLAGGRGSDRSHGRGDVVVGQYVTMLANRNARSLNARDVDHGIASGAMSTGALERMRIRVLPGVGQRGGEVPRQGVTISICFNLSRSA